MQRKWKRRWQRAMRSLILPSLTAGVMLFSVYHQAFANPSGGTVTSGSAIITTTGSTTTVNQATNKASINWQSFSIGAGEKVQFVQPSASSVALNRIVGNNASSIYGTLSANGKVFLINPNGILFAPGSQVNVGSLVASTLPISDADFQSGQYRFSGKGGSVINQGSIITAEGGYAALLGGQVSNQGTIVAKQGTVALGAGSAVTLDMNGDGLVNFVVDQGALNALAENQRFIQADGGLVVMAAKSADTLAGTVVNNGGVIRARSISNKNGTIRLEGNGKVINSGSLDVAGNDNGQTGGTVKVLGNSIVLEKGTTVDASGSAGGGTILVGGSFQGGGSEQRAASTTVAAGAELNADAGTSGNGGSIVVWADGATTFAGSISAKGGSQSGDGGQVETSGKQTLTLTDSAIVNTTAVKGKTGNWLLDPMNFTIGAGVTGANYLNTADLANKLSTSAVTVQTSTSGAEAGDITVADVITWSSANSLTLSAYHDIKVNAPITNTNGAAISLRADNTGTGSGTVSFGAGGHVTASGTVSLYYNPASTTSYTVGGYAVSVKNYASPTDYSPYLTATTSNAYMLVNTLNDLQAVAMNLSGKYALGKDIDALNTVMWWSGSDQGFIPIGTDAINNFCGIFDGLGHSINRLTISSTQTNVGLFGYTGYNNLTGKTAIIQNVVIGGMSAVIGTGTASTPANVGGLVGYNVGTITNCYVKGDVRGSYANIGGLVGQNIGSVKGSGSENNEISALNSAASAVNRLGGLVGYNYNSAVITNCYSTSTVSGENAHIVGGLVGYNYYLSSISNSWTSGSVSGLGSGSSTAHSNIGGLVGYNGQMGSIANCYSSSAVTQTGDYYSDVGGLVGYNNLGRITGSYATGDVTGLSGGQGYVGGLVGRYFGNDQYLINSYSSSKVLNGSYTGGLVGYAEGADTPIYNCYSTGNVTSDYTGGGLVGYNGTTISNSYSSGTIVSTNASVGVAGGLVGENAGLIQYSYSLGSVTGGGFRGGLVGYNRGVINDSYSTGAVAGSGIGIGGLIGRNGTAGSYGYNFWDKQTSGQTTAIGTNNNTSSPSTSSLVALTTGQMLTASSFSNWSVADTSANLSNYSAYPWVIVKGVTRPFLVSEYSTSITNAHQLQLMALNLGGSYTLVNHVDAAVTGSTAASGVWQGSFVPIGSSTQPFTGTFDGKYFTVSNLYSMLPAGGLGLFGYTASGAVVRNVGIVSGQMLGGDSSPVGALVGVNNGTVANCYSTDTTAVTDYLGFSGSSISTACGGLVGQNNGTITGSYSTYTVMGATAGGLVGRNDGTIENSYSTGRVIGYSTASSTAILGGLVGYNPGSINYSYSTSSFSESDALYSSSKGGLVGKNSGSISNGYWDIDTSQVSAGIGSGTIVTVTGLTSQNNASYDSAFKQQSYSGFFSGGNTAWRIYDDHSYPLLRSFLTPLTITLTGGSKVYDGTAYTGAGYSISVTPTSYLLGGISYTYTDTLTSATSASAVNAGIYTLSDKGFYSTSQQGGYDIIYESGTVGIAARPITVTPNAGQSKIYGEPDPALVYTVTAGSLVGSDMLSGSLSRDGGTNVGTYAFLPGTLSNSNYAITFNLSANTFAVTPRPITITPNSGQSKIYGEADPTLTYTVTGGSGTTGSALVGSDTLSGSLSRVAGLDVGSYAISQGSLASSSNYTITYSNPYTFDITARPITITPNTSQGKIYGEADPTLTYTVTAGAGTTGSALVGSDTLTGSLSRAGGSDVGTYVISQGTLTNSNYSITYSNPSNYTFAITARPITVTPNSGQSKIYGEADPTLTYTVTAGAGTTGSALVGSDTLIGSLIRAGGSDVGTYAINQGTLTNSNYSITYSNPYTFAITARPITITPNAGQGKIYGEADPTLTYTVTAGTGTTGSALVGGDTLTGSLSRAGGSDVGPYAISQGSLAGSSNYTITYSNPSNYTFAITARPITITPNSGQSKIYGEVDPTLAYTITAGSGTTGSAFAGSDTQSSVLSGVLGRDTGANAGTYDYNLGTLASTNSNYSITYSNPSNYTFAISARPITITPNASQGKTYGEADPTLTYTVTGGAGTTGSALVGSDMLSGGLGWAGGSGVGTYSISQGSLSGGSNYTITYNNPSNYTFAITARPITITPNVGQSKIYGEADSALTYTVTGGAGTTGSALVGSDTLSGSLARTAGSDAGTYAFNQGSLTSNSNYTITYSNPSNYTFAITARPITITPNAGQSKIYGEADPTLTYTITAGAGTTGAAFAGTDTQSGVLSGNLSRDAGSNAGTYAISQGSLASNSNYTVTYSNSSNYTFAITARPITITPNSGQSKIYGEADPALPYTVTAGAGTTGGAFAGSDTQSGVLSGNLSRAGGDNVGPYAISQGSLASNSNYSITYSNPSNYTFAITARSITITPNSGQGKVYGEVDPTLTYIVTGGIGETLSGSLVRDTGSDVGTYGFNQGTLTNASNPNYSITYSNPSNYTFAITPRPITITPNAGQSKIYGEAEPATLSYTVTAGAGTTGAAFAGTDTQSGVLSGNLSRAGGDNVGPYAISQGSLASNSNYSVTYSNPSNYRFAITARPITITPNAGQSKIYGEADTAITYTVTAGAGTTGPAFAGSDTQNGVLSGNLSRAGGDNVGTYAISQGSLASNSNYSITYSNPSNYTVAITARPITITPNAGQSKIYGEADPTLTYTVSAGTGTTGSALAGSDVLTGALDRTAGSNAGNYAINQGTLSDYNNPNYNITFASGAAFTINQRNLTVRADNVAKYAGQANPAFTASYIGLINGDTPSSLTGTLDFSTAAGISSKAGSYDIFLTGTLASPNYSIQYGNGVLTVRQRIDAPYHGAVIYADQTNFSLSGRNLIPGWGLTNGYQAGTVRSDFVPLRIIGSGLNIDNYAYQSF